MNIQNAGLVSAFINVGGRLGSDVVQLVSVVRQIAIKACVVFSAGLIVSIAAFIALRRLEPEVPVTVATAAAREGSPGPRPAQRCDKKVVTNTITSSSGAGSSGDDRVAGAAIADRHHCADVKVTHRMQLFSETHV